VRLKQEHLGVAVVWEGQRGTIVGIHFDPAAVVELENGRTVTVSQSTIERTI
jgi:hypothetical protein